MDDSTGKIASGKGGGGANSTDTSMISSVYQPQNEPSRLGNVLIGNDGDDAKKNLWSSLL